MRLDHEKQERIIKAALTEFAEKGYKAASTNTIIKNAQIGKGMLFYYFGSKEELFNFICDYSVEYMNNNYFAQIEVMIKDSKGDIFDRFRKLSRVKYKAVTDNPELFRFFEGTITRDYYENFATGAKRYNELRMGVMRKLFSDYDKSLFREGLDPDKSVVYIKWLFDAYERDLSARYKTSESEEYLDLKREWSKYDDFIEDLRKIFYGERKE